MIPCVMTRPHSPAPWPASVQQRLAFGERVGQAVIGDQYLAIFAPIVGHLLPLRRDPRIIMGALNLDNATLRFLAGKRLDRRGFLELVLGEKPAVRKACAPVLEIDDAAYSRLEGPANIVE
jgi:hypothetical protein